MNLENLNLVELNAQEVEEIEGGGLLIFPITGFICGYLYEEYIA
jgi:ABC-type multidrug transport system permease subunit